jgi:hypothetical protein
MPARSRINQMILSIQYSMNTKTPGRAAAAVSRNEMSASRAVEEAKSV